MLELALARKFKLYWPEYECTIPMMTPMAAASILLVLGCQRAKNSNLQLVLVR